MIYKIIINRLDISISRILPYKVLNTINKMFIILDQLFLSLIRQL